MDIFKQIIYSNGDYLKIKLIYFNIISFNLVYIHEI